jgi:argininosuccinate lyase
MTGRLSDDLIKRAWAATAHIFAAHLTMLRDVSILDEAALAALLDAVDSVAHSMPAARSLSPMLREFEQRVDTISPPEVRGAHHVGRGSADTLATATRLVIRADLISLAGSANNLRATLLDLAGANVFSLVAAFAEGQPAQPTTIAHLLSGVIDPLRRASDRLRIAFEAVNQSPMGAAALASTGFEIDPNQTSALLGFARPIDNSFDAVSALDHVVEALHVLSATVLPVSRILNELLQWIRSQPEAIQLGEGWLASDPSLLQFEYPEGLRSLGSEVSEVERKAASLSVAIATTPYGPVIGQAADSLLTASAVISSASVVLDRTAELFAEGLQFNRALLANRAGKGMITSSDLADFLMLEEQLPPSAAQAIATRAIASARKEGREASGITPELIDSAALMIIGRELQVEFETISRYLAPRRFIERRALPGGPAPSAMRAYIEEARNRLAEDVRWQEEVAARVGISNQPSPGLRPPSPFGKGEGTKGVLSSPSAEGEGPGVRVAERGEQSPH